MTAAVPGAEWDPEAPSTARIWNLWLGAGRGSPARYGPADAAKAAEIEAACPAMPQMARDARLFSARVTAWAAAEGITQFIELGAGLPPGPGIHDIARSVRPGARVVYVDNDPLIAGADPRVPAELYAWLSDEERRGIAVVAGDLTRPCALMRDARLRAVIDQAEPCCLLATGVLHMMTPRRVRSLIRSWASLLAPGSVIAATAPVVPDELTRQKLARVHLHSARYDVSPQEFAGWLGGLDLVDPGVAPAAGLRPGWADAPEMPRGKPYVIAGAGVRLR